jgi:hypothetical protein
VSNWHQVMGVALWLYLLAGVATAALAAHQIRQAEKAGRPIPTDPFGDAWVSAFMGLIWPLSVAVLLRIKARR